MFFLSGFVFSKIIRAQQFSYTVPCKGFVHNDSTSSLLAGIAAETKWLIWFWFLKAKQVCALSVLPFAGVYYFVLVYLILAVLRSLWLPRIQKKKLFIRCTSTARQVTAGLKRSVVVDRSVSKKENSKGCPSWHLSHLSRSASCTVHITARCAPGQSCWHVCVLLFPHGSNMVSCPFLHSSLFGCLLLVHWPKCPSTQVNGDFLF